MLLGLDLGTTNVKAVVTDFHGRILGSGSAPVQLFRGRDGAVEQDIEEIWRAAISVLQQAVGAVDPAAIEAIGVSSQGGAVQVLGANGQPLGPVMSWLDQRGRAQDQALTRELGKAWFEERLVHGGAGLAIGQVLRLRQEQPDLLDRACGLGFVGDVIVSRLCGASAQDGTSAALTLLYNPKRRIYDPDLLARLGLAAERLPSLSRAQDPAGTLIPEVAREIGLRPGIPVSPAVHDQYASALAIGATRSGTVMVGTGTAWVLLAVSDQVPTPVNGDAFICHHVVDGPWGQILSMVNGGSALSWALELTGRACQRSAAIDSLLQTARSGSEGLLFWPFMAAFDAADVRPGTRGRLDGLQLHHSPAHIIRAVLEGLVCELNRYLGLLQGAGQGIDRLIVTGGAAASVVTPSIIADITGLPLRCYAEGAASAMGAAILARGVLEPKTSLAHLADTMAPSFREVLPGEHATFYQAQYQRYLESLPLLN